MNAEDYKEFKKELRRFDPDIELDVSDSEEDPNERRGMSVEKHEEFEHEYCRLGPEEVLDETVHWKDNDGSPYKRVYRVCREGIVPGIWRFKEQAVKHNRLDETRIRRKSPLDQQF